jgi:hypothetical protein
MIFGLFVLFTALLISGVAAWYSIVGLMAIFSGAALAIAIMGGVLEVGKLVTASWLYNYWKVVPKFLKIYLTSAVVGLMFITSMGIFGFLSKAHLEQTAMSEEQIAQISVHEGKLVRSNAKLQRWNDDIGRLNRGENVRVDLLIKTEQEQLNIIYDRIKDEKAQLKVIADEQVVVQENKLTEYAERTKTDLALLQQRPDGKIDEETGKTEKEIAIDKVRKRDRGVSWVARDKMRKISEQLRKDFDKIGNDYAPQIGTINTRIQELRQQAQLKTEDLDAKIIQLEGFINKEQDIVDDIREDKLVLEQAYRQLEVEVGPVKYIAEFIYGDNAVGMLDSAVRGVILLLIFVFDPLAVLLVIAGNMTIRQYIDLKPLNMRKENDDDVRVEQEDIPERPVPETEPESEPEPPEPEREIRLDEDVTEHKEEEEESIPEPSEKVQRDNTRPLGKATRSHEPGIAGVIHPEKDEETEQNINEIKEILEKADPEVREEVAKELEKEEEVVPVLVDKSNKTVLEPLVNKGRALLKSLASGKSKKVSWIDTPHESKH